MGISIWQLLIILIIIALLFGTKKLKNMGGDIGGAIKGFKKALNEDEPKPLEKKDGEIIEGKAEKVEAEQEKKQK